MAVYLYKPPSYRARFRLAGRGLIPGIQTSTIVWRQGGVWHNAMTVGMDNPVVASVDVYHDPTSGTDLRLFFTKPMVVPGALHDELAALQPADPSWTPGSLTLL